MKFNCYSEKINMNQNLWLSSLSHLQQWAVREILIKIIPRLSHHIYKFLPAYNSDTYYSLYLFVLFIDVNWGIRLISFSVWPVDSPGQLRGLLRGLFLGSRIRPRWEAGQFRGTSLSSIFLPCVLLVLKTERIEYI